MKTCSISGCSRGVKSKGRCAAHYQRLRSGSANTDPAIKVMDPSRGCSVVGCGRSYFCKGLCRAHYKQHRRAVDLNCLIGDLLRHRLYSALRAQDATKTSSAVRDLGCTIPELRTHLEKQFRPGMTWENQGEWHVDHVKPLAKFDLAVPEQQRAGCHFSNLQPLWAHENLSKRDRWAA